MKNTFGNSVALTIFGESHGPEIGAVLDGLAPGITVDEAFIDAMLQLRRPVGKISTSRVETDPYRIVSGVFNGKTTGTPIAIVIPNSNTKSKDYAKTRALARPGHADYTAWEKYHGFEDYRGGGHFSGRITTGLVAAGAICLKALEQKGILIGTHIAKCAKVEDRPFEDLQEDILSLRDRQFAVLSEEKGEAMKAAIEAAAADKDSVGGVLETAIIGLPAGVGEPWFDTVEGVLSHALFSIPAIKGIEFGEAFSMVDERGSRYNDAFRVEDGKVITKTNHNGGINGGITNGMPVTFRLAVKPTPTIFQKQETVNFQTMENAEVEMEGRHDPAVIHRARVVVDCVTALVICDMLSSRFGTDYLGEA